MRTNLSEQFNPTQRQEWKPKIVARNTFKFTREGETVIRLHGTDIVRKLPDGSVILNSGGWKTVTTKERMNAQMPQGYFLFQEKGAWYVLQHGKVDHWNGKRVPFYDGIQVPQCFDKMPAKAAKQEKQELALRGKIRKFVAKLDKLECLPEPSQGDCWYCAMHVVSPEKDKGKALGEATGDSSHILSHIKEGYLHGSLILNALKWAGYRNPEFVWHLSNNDLKRGKRPDMVKRALKRYLYRQLGLVS